MAYHSLENPTIPTGADVPLAEYVTDRTTLVIAPRRHNEENQSQRISPNAISNQNSNLTAGNDRRLVFLAWGSYSDPPQTSSPERDFTKDGFHPVGDDATEKFRDTNKPTVIDGSPAGTSSIVTHLVDGDSLKSTLNNDLLVSQYDRTSLFLPRSAVQQLVLPGSIKSYWLAHTERQLHERCADVINYVCGLRASESRQARQVFALLLLIDEPALILDIIKENVYDDDLPLVRINKQGTDFQLARKTDKRRPVGCFNTWTTVQRLSFEIMQWQVIAPIFRKAVRSSQSSELKVFEFDDRAVLPIVEYDIRNKYQGNSQVVRVKIHRAHHHFNTEENQSFALKSLKSEDLSAFRLEVIALAKIKPKPHLVSLLTAFKYQHKYHLLFRWAEGGNLANLWSQLEIVANYKSVCWLAEQCYGLADGLDGIHNAKLSEAEVAIDQITSPSMFLRAKAPFEDRDIPFFRGDDKCCGRHGDIKPQNILWFKQDMNQYGYGVLRISDFGLTTFHSASTTKVGNVVPVTLSYAAPERVIDSDLSRAFDIWSLGCVYLEFVTWLLLGSEQVQEFKRKRLGKRDDRTKFETDEFYSVYRETNRTYATVKEPVTEWIDYLKGLPACSRFHSEFLDYIQTKMLVVDKAERDRCRQVRKRLKDMYEKCKTNPEYAISSSSESSVVQGSRLSGVIREGILDERNGRSVKVGKENRDSIMAKMKQRLRNWCF